jgi:leucokinin receptor
LHNDITRGNLKQINQLPFSLFFSFLFFSFFLHHVCTRNRISANLAMADVIIGMFSIPFQFQAAVQQRWDLPKIMCPFCPFVQILSVNVSIFTLTAIAIDRHKAILNPLRARSSKHASKIIIAIIWIVAFLLAAPISYGLRVVDLTHYIYSKLL